MKKIANNKKVMFEYGIGYVRGVVISSYEKFDCIMYEIESDETGETYNVPSSMVQTSDSK